jgi:hypothetical protein
MIKRFDRWRTKMAKEKTSTEAKVFEERQPTFSRSITKSKDGKWFIIRSIRTDIVHVNYVQKILETEK